MPKLKMLKSSLPILDPAKAMGLRMLDDVIREQKRKAKRTGRDADPRRLLPLNGAAWQKLRAQVLANEPLCRHCTAQGMVTAATDVDHINNDPTDNRPEALQSLCKPCHSRKTQADMGKRVSYGCDSKGMPLDPSHPWFQKSL